MKNVFSNEKMHTVTEANINFYAKPFVHPKRKMSEHDFIYLLSGEWKFGQNDKTYTLKEDCLLILGGGNLHYGISPCLPETKTMYFHVSREEGDFSGEKIPQNYNGVCCASLINASNNKKIKRIFSEIVNCKLSGNQRKANLYFELLICELSEAEAYNTDTATAEKIKNIIHRNPERFFGNKELAEMVNVSLKTAETKFKAMFGMTIHQYMLDFKIKQAISYFDVFPEISIKEIALNLGFYDEYHFSRQFKKITGIAPIKYKKGSG